MASPEILQPQLLQHNLSNDYKPVQTIITKPKLSKTVIQTTTVSSEFEKQRKEKTTDTTRRKGIPS